MLDPMPDVDIVVPVHDEQTGLEASIRRLHRFLRDGFPFSWRIVIADNASTDATPAVAAALAEDLPGVVVMRLAGGGVAERLAGARGLVRLVADGVVARFLAIGAASTLAFALLYVALHALLGAAGANAAALALTAVGNTAANRRVTFRVRGREGLWRHHARGAAVFVLTLALTTGALTVLHALDPAPPRWLELGVLVAATPTATVTRYVALRTWVFRASPLTPPARTRCAPSPRAGSIR
jgi:putative flippase GtrA